MIHHDSASSAPQAWFIENSPEGVATGFCLKHATCLHREQTDYQLIEIYETEKFGKLMVFDGLVMLTDRDNFLYHEMLCHPALLCHPQPQRVAIIGGGDCGSLREVLKHDSIVQVTQIEIDERVTRVAEQFFPELCSANDDTRAQFVFDDGIAWMANAADNSLDLILIDSTDPIGPAEGLFREPFYRDCLRVLGKNGIIAQQSESPFIHLNTIVAMHAALQQVGFSQTELLPFPQPSYPSGWWSITLASANTNAFTPRVSPIATQYYSDAIMAAARSLPPFIQARLRAK
jgi:spermidine synthase